MRVTLEFTEKELKDIIREWLEKCADLHSEIDARKADVEFIVEPTYSSTEEDYDIAVKVHLPEPNPYFQGPYR